MITEKERERYNISENDTGSTVSQILLLAEKIQRNKEHLKENHKDFPLKRALLRRISKARRFFKYLSKKTGNKEVSEMLKKNLEIIK
jgi:ribosomal protein S15